MKKIAVFRSALLALGVLFSSLDFAQSDNFTGRADTFDKLFNKTASKVGIVHRLEFVECSGTLCNYKATGNVFVTVMAESKTDKTMTSVSAVLASDTEHLGFAMAVMNTIASFSPELNANARLEVFTKIVDDGLSAVEYGQRVVGNMKYSMRKIELVGLWFTAERVD